MDILGFDKLASEISKKARIEERKIRMDFITIINNEVSKLQKSGYLHGVRYGQSDDWLLVVQSLDDIYYILDIILNHSTGYRDYDKIPLEIGIGYSEFDENADLEGIGLSTENNTISFLKSYIINEYRNWYKDKYNTSIKESFIVLTKDCYANLGVFCKDHCFKIISNAETFYQLDIEFVLKRAQFIDFLKEINLPTESLYGSLNDVFVKPNEYNSIIELLEKDNVVFIVGDPEIGKTFTAIKILWTYYQKGYKPIWKRGYDFSDRNEIRKMMGEGNNLLPGHILYLEDPFGKIQYEDTDTIRREIGTYINIIKNMDVKVVFTSRLHIFNQFLRAKISEEEIKNISIDMLLINPSYDIEKNKLILINWSKYFNTKWFHKKELKTYIFTHALKYLKTPLSIRDFVIETINMNNYNEIKLVIEKKSVEIKKSFAEEIKNMSKEKILYLNLNYILFLLEPNEIKKIYEEICLNNNLNFIIENYGELSQEFQYKIQKAIRIEFTHSSYEEGLVESWNDPVIFHFLNSTIFSLLESANPIVRGLIGFSLTKNYNYIKNKESIKPIILKVITDKNVEARNGVASAARYYHKELPSTFKIELINRLTKDRHRGIRAQALQMINNDYDLVPPDIILKIINQGLNDRAASVRLDAVTFVRNHLKSIPKEMASEALECNRKLLDYSGWNIRYFASIYYSFFKKEVEEYLMT